MLDDTAPSSELVETIEETKRRGIDVYAELPPPERPANRRTVDQIAAGEAPASDQLRALAEEAVANRSKAERRNPHEGSY